jgi:hypothetical protein
MRVLFLSVKLARVPLIQPQPVDGSETSKPGMVSGPLRKGLNKQISAKEGTHKKCQKSEYLDRNITKTILGQREMCSCPFNFQLKRISR